MSPTAPRSAIGTRITPTLTHSGVRLRLPILNDRNASCSGDINPSATWLDHATATRTARVRGARLIVVDPRRTGFAGRADQWLRVRPGADGALALGIAGEMIRNGWFDVQFVRDWTNGPLLVRKDTNRFLRAGDIATPPAGAMADDLVAWDAEAKEAVGYSLSRRAYVRPMNPELDVAVEFYRRPGSR